MTRSSRRPPWKVAVQTVAVIVVLGFFARAILETWRETSGSPFPNGAAIGCAAVAGATALLAGAGAWVVLLGHHDRRAHSAGFLVSQLAKYVPGGVAQVMGQVRFANAAGVRTSRAVTAFATLAVCQAVAGLTVSSLLVVALPNARIPLALGVLSVILLDRRWMVWAVHRIPMASEAHARDVPGQRQIVGAWSLLLLLVVAFGVAYLAILGSLVEVTDPALVVVAFAAAWTIGYLAVPVPAGFGIRELVLVATLGSVYPSNVLVSASVYLRLTLLGVEGVLALAAFGFHGRRTAVSPADGSADPCDDEAQFDPSSKHPREGA